MHPGRPCGWVAMARLQASRWLCIGSAPGSIAARAPGMPFSRSPVTSMERSFIARLSGVDVSGRKTYDLVDEPTGDDYRAMLVCARAQCDTAVLSLDTNRDLDPGGQEIVDRLATQLRSESRSGHVRLLRYEFSQACIDVLGEVSGLFAWRQPGLPENLCLLRADGSPWIVSIAADRIGYVEFTPFEKLLLGRAAPGLAAVLAHQGARDAVLAAFERRLEDAADALEADLLVYARALAEEGREGIVAAGHDWLGSGEVLRRGAGGEAGVGGPGAAGPSPRGGRRRRLSWDGRRGPWGMPPPSCSDWMIA